MDTESSLSGGHSTQDPATHMQISTAEHHELTEDQIALINSSHLQVQFITSPAVMEDHHQQQHHQQQHQQQRCGSVDDHSTATLVELTSTDQHPDGTSIVGLTSIGTISNLNNITTWRSAVVPHSTTYYETPLTSATNTMLNIHAVDESGVASIVYDTAYRHDDGSPGVTAVQDAKLANTVADGTTHVDAVYMVGGVEGVKREPEDLTRRSISPSERMVVDRRRMVYVQTLVNAGSSPGLDPATKQVLEAQVKEEGGDRPRLSLVESTIIRQETVDGGDKMSAAGGYIGFAAASPQGSYDHAYIPSPQSYTTIASPVIRGPSVSYTTGSDQYYNDYTQQQYTIARPEYATAPEPTFDRYPRPGTTYKTDNLNVDSSPDSGTSSDPGREHTLFTAQNFAYEDINSNGSGATLITGDMRSVAHANSSPNPLSHNTPTPSSLTPATLATTITTNNKPACWQEYSRPGEETENRIQIPKIHNDDDKVHIPKNHSIFGFKFYFESPISTSQRKEDDRMTYINKGQYYSITMEYKHDPDKPLKSDTVKSIVMLMFREEKTPEDEQKAWHFWHGRQHSVRQRIIDVDTNHNVGVVGNIEEISHNAIAVYWHPLQGAKINVAIQCLSTDFSSQKGVKGLPLHIQIDTYDDTRGAGLPVFHRAYCQIKVFCDKGAERKTRDEERRAQKRRLSSTTSRRRSEDLYHPPSDRSEFYSMADLYKETVLFQPSDEAPYMNMEIQNPFYDHEAENGSSDAGTMEIPTAPTSTSPSSLTGSARHSIPYPPDTLSPSQMSPQHTSIISLSNHTSGHLALNANRESVKLSASPSLPAPTSSTLLLLSNTPSLVIASSVSPGHNSPSHVSLLPTGHSSPIDNQHYLYHQPQSPLELQLSSNSIRHSTAGGNHISTNHLSASFHGNSYHSLHIQQHQQQQQHNHTVISNSDLPSPRDSHSYPSNPSTPNTTADITSATPPSAVFAKTITSPAYGDPHKNHNGVTMVAEHHIRKRPKVIPSPSEQVMIYVRKSIAETIYTPLRLVPPTTSGLLAAIQQSFGIPANTVKNVLKKTTNEILVRVEDFMIRDYSNEDTYLLDITRVDHNKHDITLIEEIVTKISQ